MLFDRQQLFFLKFQRKDVLLTDSEESNDADDLQHILDKLVKPLDLNDKDAGREKAKESI